MRVCHLAVCAVLAGCGYESVQAHTFGYGPGLACPDGDVDCSEVKRHLDTIEAETGHFCGTVRLAAELAIIAMGERAVPALRRALETEAHVHVRVAERILAARGRP